MPSDPNAPETARESRDIPTEAPSGPDDAPTVSALADARANAPADHGAPTGAPNDLHGMLAPAQRPDELGRLGRYRVLRVLGRGGMGIVFEAEDEKLKRRVALKAMLPALATSPAARGRFAREAEANAKVEHDNIVPIYDIVESNGVVFLAMPLLVGTTLDVRLKAREPLPIPDLLLVGRNVAEGLAAAHAVGLIHRDIKPSNIWLEMRADRTPNAEVDRPEPKSELSESSPSPLSSLSSESTAFRIPESAAGAGVLRRARILDFGLARSLRDTGVLTQSGAVMGTPAYMAPEQARGQAVDHRADLFSLGCVLYQMATGQRPFRGEDTFAVLTALATDTPAPPAALNPAVPPALSTLIERLLSKNPADRWPPTAQAVADELARIATAPLPPVPVVVPAPRAEVPTAEDRTADLTEVMPRGVPRRRVWRAAALVAVGLFALAAIAYGLTRDRPRNPPDEPVVKADEPKQEPLTAEEEQRKALRWVLDAGGSLTLEIDDKTVELRGTTAQLPDGPFRVRSLSLAKCETFNDGAVARLRALPPVSDALNLSDTKLTTAGLEAVAALPNLGGVRRLELAGLPLAALPFASALESLKKFPLCAALDLSRTNIDDDEVMDLAELGTLTQLDVRKTQVTKFGVECLAGLRPDLRVTWDEGTIEPVTASKPVDLLALIDPRRDAVSGRWQMVDGRLEGGGAAPADPSTEKLQVPYAPPTEYDAVLRIQRVAIAKSDGTPALALTLTGPAQFQAVFDWRDGKTVVNGLHLIDGKSFLENPTRTHGDFFGAAGGGGTVITCRVRKDEVVVLVNGQVRFGWKGDVSKLTHDDAFGSVPDKTRLAIAVQNAEYRVRTWKVYPLAASPAEQRKALEWVLRTGGTLGLVVDGKVQSFSAADKLPDGPFEVESVDVNGQDIDDAAVEQLRHVPPVRYLLRLRHTAITDAGLATLADFPGLTNIRYLSFAGVAITDDGLLHLKRFRQLDTLSLRRSQVTSAGLVHLKNMTNLRLLYLQDIAVTDGGLLHLKHLPNLIRLELGGTQVTEAGLPTLAEFKALTELNLNNLPITDDGLRHLAGCKNLTALNLTGTKVTKVGAEKLAQALPKCKIEYDGGVIEPKLDPPGDEMPLDAAFPGEVIVREPFDKAPAHVVIQDTKQVTTRIANGVFESRWHATPDDRPGGFFFPFGAPAEHRVRAPGPSARRRVHRLLPRRWGRDSVVAVASRRAPGRLLGAGPAEVQEER